jgi:uncharacterized surface protein with fasciclin (FAS1) repeats
MLKELSSMSTFLSRIAVFAVTLPLMFGSITVNADGHGKHKKDIVDTAVSAGSFNTLVATVKAAGLVKTLKGKGPFTVFAPTDAAFAQLPAGTLESLLKPENKSKLAAILTCHVLPGKVMASDIAGKSLKVATVQGSKVSVDAMKGVKIDNATVVKADVVASDGVIHVIDTVIMPPTM